MPQDDPVQKALAGAKDTLAKATKFTKTVEGNPTSTFAPKKPEPLHVPQAKHEFSGAPYSLAKEAGSAAAGLKAKADNIKEYTDVQ